MNYSYFIGTTAYEIETRFDFIDLPINFIDNI